MRISRQNTTIIGFMSVIFLFSIFTIYSCSDSSDKPEMKEKVTEEHGNEDKHDDHKDEKNDEHKEDIELSEEALEGMSLKTEIVSKKSLEREIQTTAVIEPNETKMAHVTPRISGRVVDVKTLLGDSVEKGQILAELDSLELGDAKAQYLKASANLEVARANFKREERLYKQQISSEKDYLDSKGEYLRSEAEFKTAREALRLLGITDKEIENIKWGGTNDPLSHFPLTAPFAGNIVEKHIVLGELIRPEDKPYTIVDLSNLWIQLDIYEKDLALVKNGTKVRIKTDAYPQESFEGNVTYISDLLDESTRTAKARVEIPNTDRKLKPGMFATAIISVPSLEDEKVITVPQSAIYKINEKPIAFVQEGDRKFEMRELIVGKNSSSYVEIKDGLNVGDKVVTEGGFHLKSALLKEELGGGHGH